MNFQKAIGRLTMKRMTVRQVIIRNAQWLDFAKAVTGMIILLIIFIFLCLYHIDGYLIYVLLTYTAFLSGMGWGMFSNYIIRKLKEKEVKE